MLGVNDIDQKAYSLTFKLAKSNGGSLELSDSNDFEKFLNEYEKLHRLQKEIIKEVLESDEFLCLQLIPFKYPIPDVEEFLKKLDKDEGDNSDFTQFINAFIEQKITVKHIKDLDDNNFQILGIVILANAKD
ncbi:hypothetical protein C1645_825286 [Glomus cerebriforme]|uniref:Uncharacterized protein n=1 Tax=Glomus cerebriforme TaxID=658196 RepID=A0A397T1S2_9GLOM|nr:hypothetical protein C1645_825286 [Glomus cerebriforme]